MTWHFLDGRGKLNWHQSGDTAKHASESQNIVDTKQQELGDASTGEIIGESNA